MADSDVLWLVVGTLVGHLLLLVMIVYLDQATGGGISTGAWSSVYRFILSPGPEIVVVVGWAALQALEE